MKRFFKRLNTMAVIIAMLIITILPNNHAQAVDNAVAVQPPDNIQSIRRSDTSIRIKWRTVPHADGHIINISNGGNLDSILRKL